RRRTRAHRLRPRGGVDGGGGPRRHERRATAAGAPAHRDPRRPLARRRGRGGRGPVRGAPLRGGGRAVARALRRARPGGRRRRDRARAARADPRGGRRGPPQRVPPGPRRVPGRGRLTAGSGRATDPPSQVRPIGAHPVQVGCAQPSVEALMRTALNVIWLLLCGIWLAIGYVLAGVICCLLVVTIPFGLAAFRIADFTLWPFGRRLVRRADAGVPSVIGNVVWIVVAGWWLALGHIATAIALAITIIGIPLALANLKLIPVSLVPLGRVIVDSDDLAAGRYPAVG